MTKLKELLDKEELEHIKEVKEDIIEENSAKKRSSEESSTKEESNGNVSMKENSEERKGSNTWIWVAAIVAAVIILR